MNEKLENLLKDLIEINNGKFNKEELLKIGNLIVKAYHNGKDDAYKECMQIVQGNRK